MLARAGGHVLGLELGLRRLHHGLLLPGEDLLKHLLRTSSPTCPAHRRPRDRRSSRRVLGQLHAGAAHGQRGPARVCPHSNSEGLLPILKNRIPPKPSHSGSALAGLPDQLSRPCPHPGHPLVQLPQAHHLLAGGIHQWTGGCLEQQSSWKIEGTTSVIHSGWCLPSTGSDGLPWTSGLSNSY